jgi:hypothetical protein
VLEALQPDGPSKPEDGGLGFSQALAAVRLVCAAWKMVHDAMVTRLVLSRETTDEAVGTLVRRFPTVVSLEVKGAWGVPAALTDQGLRAVSSLASLTFLDLSRCQDVTDEGVRAVVSSCTALKTLNLSYCRNVTDEGVRAVSSLPALTFLDLAGSKVTDEGVRAASSLPALTFLDLGFTMVTDEGVRAVASSCTALTALDLRCCRAVTDVGVRALSSLPALASLDLRWCSVTAAGVQALRNTTAAPNLRIEWEPPAEDEEDAEDSDDSDDQEDWEQWD